MQETTTRRGKRETTCISSKRLTVSRRRTSAGTRSRARDFWHKRRPRRDGPASREVMAGRGRRRLRAVAAPTAGCVTHSRGDVAAPPQHEQGACEQNDERAGGGRRRESGGRPAGPVGWDDRRQRRAAVAAERVGDEPDSVGWGDRRQRRAAV